MRSAPFSSGLCLAIVVASCGPPVGHVDAGDSACGDGPGSVEVGVGGSRLSPLADGDPLPIVRGAQGGIHVVIGAWVRDMAIDDVRLRYWLEDPDGARIGFETTLELGPAFFSPATGGGYQRHPDLVVLNHEMANVDDFAGRPAVLRAEARATDGTHACDARDVVLTPAD